MSDPFVGEIRIFAGTFAPSGWALCQGQLLPIQQNAALFSLLGTTYGGNGQTTFGLPNLQGRAPISFGTLAGGSTYVQGQAAGAEHVTLTANNLAVHTHPYAPQESSAAADQTDPTGAIPAMVNDGTRGGNVYPGYTKTAATGTMQAQTTGAAGGSVPVSVLQPYLVLNFIIALVGIFPSRS
jgi:microcystin-dependent protein